MLTLPAIPASATALGWYALGVVAVYVIARWLWRPLGWAVTLLWRGLIGGVVVWGVDLVGRSIGLHVALNPVTALVAGFLGLPGLAALVALSL